MFDLDAVRVAESTLRDRFCRTELIHSHHFSGRLGASPLHLRSRSDFTAEVTLKF